MDRKRRKSNTRSSAWTEEKRAAMGDQMRQRQAEAHAAGTNLAGNAIAVKVDLFIGTEKDEPDIPESLRAMRWAFANVEQTCKPPSGAYKKERDQAKDDWPKFADRLAKAEREWKAQQKGEAVEHGDVVHDPRGPDEGTRRSIEKCEALIEELTREIKNEREPNE